MTNFDGKIVVLGYGAVSHCVLPLIFKNFNIKPEQIIILDAKPQVVRDLNFFVENLNINNFNEILLKYLKPNDLLLDLANHHIDSDTLLKWCHKNQIFYLNTNIIFQDSTLSLNLNYRKIKNLKNEYNFGPTAIVGQGANPGLISSFVKAALVDFSKAVLNKQHLPELECALACFDFKEMAHLLQINVIHISEIDTQFAPLENADEYFINTWSVQDLILESTSNVEFAWGTHEQQIPENAHIIDQNIFFHKKAIDFKVKSWVPKEEFVSMIPIHDESYSIADYLSIKENNEYVYRPTCLFVYKPCPQAIKSLDEYVKTKIKKIPYIINDEIISGQDKMGILLMSSKYGSYWLGSLLDIKQANSIVPGQNATTMQVAAGVIAGLDFIFNNQDKGICFPEDLDFEQVLKIAKPYLGQFVSMQVDWQPETLQFQSFILLRQKPQAFKAGD